MRILRLALKGEYFDQIRDGLKFEEYRTIKPFWPNRLMGRGYDEVWLTRGYPSKNDASRILRYAYTGYRVKTIQHPHFGESPVSVFAILLPPAKRIEE